MKKLITILLSLLYLSNLSYATVCLTDQEYEKVLDRLKKDKEIIDTNNKRWGKLKESKPKINYDISDGNIVIQTIEIPIYQSKPLIYEVKFKIEQKQPKENLVPLTFFLYGGIETYTKVDAKVGIKLLNLGTFNEKLPIGVNFMVGVRSFGTSLSYTFPKPFHNTAIHIVGGYSYDFTKTVGIGVSLNF